VDQGWGESTEANEGALAVSKRAARQAIGPKLGEKVSAMTLAQLRTLAKHSGLRGYSKLRKLELFELVSGAIHAGWLAEVR
jgi:hypothetical protein